VTQVPIYASLSVGTSAAVRVAAPQTLTAATTPPTIGDVAPPQGQTVNNTRPSIYATFNAPTGVAINEHSVSLSVNGHDVTSSVTRSNAFVTYAPGIDLPSGPVTVVVRVADAAGNASTKTWSFTIGR
jgi:cytochrome c